MRITFKGILAGSKEPLVLGAQSSQQLEFAKKHMTPRLEAVVGGSKRSHSIAGARIEGRNGGGNGRCELGHQGFGRGRHFRAIAGEGEDKPFDKFYLVGAAPGFGGQGSGHDNGALDSGIKVRPAHQNAQVHVAPQVPYGGDHLYA